MLTKLSETLCKLCLRGICSVVLGSQRMFLAESLLGQTRTNKKQLETGSDWLPAGYKNA